MPRPLGNKSTRQTRVKKLAPKKTKSEKKAERAARKPGGLTGALVLMGTLLAAGIAAAIGLEKKDKKKSDEILQRLLSKPLVKSEHAYCRMDCRHISNEEVEHALHHGRVDKPRSEFKAKPCPKIAVKDGRVTVVCADCRSDTRLVTVIDTETDWPCGPC